MKTTITFFLLFLCSVAKSQVTDILWVPDQKSLVVSQRPDYSIVGWYIGGYYTTTFPAPFIYTTPFSIINRIGLNYVGPDNKVSVMLGTYIASKDNYLGFKPDVWVKVYPLRILLNNDKGFDFSVGMNYMDGVRGAVGISIPLRGIYR